MKIDYKYKFNMFLKVIFEPKNYYFLKKNLNQ